MINEKEKTEDFFLMEKHLKKVRDKVIILSILLYLALLALYGLIFHSPSFIYTILWIFGGMYNQLLISFSEILLYLFSILICIFYIVYLWKFVSTKKIMNEFKNSREFEGSF